MDRLGEARGFAKIFYLQKKNCFAAAPFYYARSNGESEKHRLKQNIDGSELGEINELRNDKN